MPNDSHDLIENADHIHACTQQAEALVDLLIAHTADTDDITHHSLSAVKNLVHNVQKNAIKQLDLVQIISRIPRPPA